MVASTSPYTTQKMSRNALTGLLRKRSSQAAGEVETWTNDNLDSARESVRAQPLAAIALSMGAGALVGAIFLRR